MKKIFCKVSRTFTICISLLFLAVAACHAQVNVVHVDNAALPSSGAGTFYALPRTIINVEVTIDKIENYKGPYAEYAMRYLGLKNVVESSTVEYKINDIKITTSAEPDPDQYYFVELNGRGGKAGESSFLSLSESGLIIGTLGGNRDTLEKKIIIKNEQPGGVQEKDVFPEIFKYSTDMSVFEKVDTIIRRFSIDTVTMEKQVLKRTMVEKSPEQKAKEAADFISKIKDNRFNLVSGFQEVNYNRETLEYMDTQLKILEREYMKLFTGISIHRTLTFNYSYTPNPNQVNTEVPIFKFSRTKGVMDLDESGGKIITIRVQRSGTTSAVLNYLKKSEDKSKVHGFYYRIPEQARVNVKVDENLQEETVCLVSQLGPVTCLPSDRWQIRFHPETGGIRLLKID
jgi:hypothetical protein